MIPLMASGAVGVHVTQSPTSRVVRLADDAWRLEIPPNARAGYRLAQLDDHGGLRRSDFHWKPPLKMSLQARVSAPDIPGTWGFGLWNDPFSFLIAYGGGVPRLPALPEAAWFFHASPHNYLSLRDDLPGSGFLAATFHSKKVPFLLLAGHVPIDRRMTDGREERARMAQPDSVRPQALAQAARLGVIIAELDAAAGRHFIRRFEAIG